MNNYQRGFTMHILTAMKGRSLAVLAALALTLAACAGGGPGDTPSDTPADEFYKKNTKIEVIGGHDAGSGFDFYMRAVADAIESSSDFSTLVRNIPGGGGLVGDNELYETTPDGRTIGLLNFPGHAFAQLTDKPSVRYDFADWEWLGRVASGPPVLLVSADGPYQDVDALADSGKTVRFSLEEAGSDAYYGAQVSAQVFGFPAKLITGYEGTSATVAAVIRGETDATFMSYASALPNIKSGDLKALTVFAAETVDAIADVPLATDLVTSDEEKETLTAFGNVYSMERVFVAPPGTPADRVEYLRKVLADSFEDETFIKKLQDADRPLNPMPGGEVADAIQAVVDGAASLQKLLKE